MSGTRQRGNGSLKLRGRIWWVKYYYHGKPKEESSGSARRSDAMKLLRKRLGEMGTGRLIGPDMERTTFEDLATMIEADYRANELRSLDRMRRSLFHLRGVFGLSRALDITPDRLNHYVQVRMEEAAARGTIRLELAALRRAFRLAHRAGKVPAVPVFPSLRGSDPRTGFFEADDLAAVLHHLPEPLRPVMQFAYLTGWRKREVLGLTWGAVDFEAGIVRLESDQTKNRQGRTFPFGALPKLGALLRAQRERTTVVEREAQAICPWVFHRNGRPIRSYDVAWRAACRKAGLPGRIFHDFRRSAARNLVRAGVPERVAMQLTGHLTRSVFDRYAIVNESDLAEGVAKLAAWAHRGWLSVGSSQVQAELRIGANAGNAIGVQSRVIV